MLYALVNNGAIERVNITLPYTVGDTAIPAGATGLEQFGLLPILGDEPAYDPATQRMAGPTYQLDGSVVRRVYTVEQIPAEELVARVRSEIMDGVQRYLDDFATTKTYDSMLSACTYATSTVPQFAKEGQYCVEKRDECWATVARIEAEVLAGTRPAPTGFDDIKGELPALEWPAA